MNERSLLGTVDLPDDAVAEMVARLLGVPEAGLLSSEAAVSPYDIPSLTTAGRYRVSGTAEAGGRVVPWRMFVKHVQDPSRSPYFGYIPEETRPLVRRLLPWPTEGRVYRSDLADRLPAGLVMPRAAGVHDIDEASYALWLEEVRCADVDWSFDRYVEAARLLGRFAAAEAVQDLSRDMQPGTARGYLQARLAPMVLPALDDPEVWRHPLVAGAFAQLRGPLLEAAGRAAELAAELDAMPLVAGHGDAAPNNLLVRTDREGFTMIDFGFFSSQSVGFDLGQLLVGDVQTGRRSAGDLVARDEACLAAYHRGLREEGLDVDPGILRRAHALHLFLYAGLSSLPLEELGEAPTARLHALAEARAAIARRSLDLLDAL